MKAAWNLFGAQQLAVNPRSQCRLFSVLRIITWSGWWGTVCPQQVCQCHKPGRNGSYARGSSTGWRNGTSWNSKRRVQSPAPGEKRPHAPVDTGEYTLLDYILCWKAACQKRTCGSWWAPSWTSASSVSLQQTKLMVSWAALDKGLPAGWERWSYSPTWH